MQLKDIVLGCQQQDRQSMELLYKEYSNKALKTAYLMCRDKNLAILSTRS